MERIRSAFRENSYYRVFLLTIIITGLSYGIYKGITDNYMAEIVSMGEFDRGVAEFFRELPGLMLVFILAVLYMFSAERMYKIGAVIMLAGLGMITFVSPSKLMVTIAICIYSLGEHIQLGMKNTLTLEYSKENQEGRALGYQNSVYQAGNLIGFLVVIGFSVLIASKDLFRPLYFAATVIAAVSMLLSFRIKGNSETDKSKSRFYFNRKYKKYYMLEVFYGARKQVFLTFGPYVLILFYGASASIISLLFAVSAVCCFFMAPVIGKIIDRLGYKVVMVSDTLILVIVCFFYGFAHHIFPRNIAFIICCLNYILDAVISLASMASNVYVQDISDNQDEVKATISTGISVNHLITVLIALFGGWIWQTLGVETLFILSAILGLCNSAYAATIRPEEKSGKKQTMKEK